MLLPLRFSSGSVLLSPGTWLVKKKPRWLGQGFCVEYNWSIVWFMKHVLLGLLLLVVVTGCNDLKEPEDPKPPMPFNRILRTPKDIWIEYLDNPTKAEKDLKETRVRFTGKLLAVDSNKYNQEIALSLDSGLDNKHRIVIGYPESWRSTTNKLKVGESAMIEGVYINDITDPKSGIRGLIFTGTGIFGL